MHTHQELVNKAIEINPNITATHSIIWLHGLGADGSDFVPIVPELKLPKELAVRFIFPNAPVMPVTLNNGYKMPAWFDLFDLSFNGKIDEAGIKASIDAVQLLIAREEKRGIKSENIILAGFSQGSVIALMTGISSSKPLAGIMALSGCLPYADKIAANTNAANQHIPIFIAHGTEDFVLPYSLGKATYAALTQCGFPVEWHSYPMAHSVCAEEVVDISKWIVKVFSR